MKNCCKICAVEKFSLYQQRYFFDGGDFFGSLDKWDTRVGAWHGQRQNKHNV